MELFSFSHFLYEKKDILSLSDILKLINFKIKSSKFNKIFINGISDLSKAKNSQITFFLISNIWIN
ncbi:MAG: hypothetical protein FF85_03860 [alpha proteobacterium QL1]|nr:MAG: hypothetical protein FF85_03860 [alpha proteobacterium QL1]